MKLALNAVIALTADHGLTPFPEVHAHDPNAGASHGLKQSLSRENVVGEVQGKRLAPATSNSSLCR
jgi:hypothetical protein